MSLISRIIELFYPFTYSPEDFVLKNKAAWYSDRFRNILYSGNRGKSFKKLLSARPPLFTHSTTILEYNWNIDYETFDCEDTKFSAYKEKFKSLKDIEDYEKQEYQKYLNGRVNIENRRKWYLEQLNKNIE